MKSVFYVVIGVIAGFALGGVLVFISRAPAGDQVILQPAPTKSPMVVYVAGAVVQPGLYELEYGSRVQDAIESAGGLLPDAKVDTLNLTSMLEDGEQLIIPYRDDWDNTKKEETGNMKSKEKTNEVNGLININTASVDELDSLIGIGPITAQKIIDYRIENGGFSTNEEIMNVSGIGPATYEDIKDLITH
jgi:competence protein ComEA